jgi:hypothetical protein
MTTETRFEDRLLTELRAHVERHAIVAPPARARTGRRPVLRPAPIAAAGGLLAAAAVAVVLASGGDGSTPAYAVTPHHDGTVTVRVQSLSDSAGLERELRAAGVRAEVRALPAGTMCAPPQSEATTREAGQATMAVQSTTQHGSATTMTLSPATLPEDATLLITTSGGDADGGPSSIAMAIVHGTGDPCRVVPAPAPAPTTP